MWQSALLIPAQPIMEILILENVNLFVQTIPSTQPILPPKDAKSDAPIIHSVTIIPLSVRASAQKVSPTPQLIFV